MSVAQDVRNEAIDRADVHANEAWKACMYDCIERVAAMKPEFTADDVFDLYDAIEGAPTTHLNCAFGPVILRAAKARICEKVNFGPLSRRLHIHRNLMLWRSLIYEGATA